MDLRQEGNFLYTDKPKRQQTGGMVLPNTTLKNTRFMTKKLTRSENKMIGGVCGGIAEYLDVDPTVVRVVYACLTLFTAIFLGICLYIILLILMPSAEYHD